ncbi:protein of unknown function [Cyanobium sp. NIES-981]|nr:protein of unknown function [Cyanobium sp. NIES-981]
MFAILPCVVEFYPLADCSPRPFQRAGLVANHLRPGVSKGVNKASERLLELGWARLRTCV